MQELLREQNGQEVPYSTLTYWVRELQLREEPPARVGHYDFAPGQEMQHDTSPHRLRIGGTLLTAQCAALVLGFSRIGFIQYYPRFTRFEAQVFLDAAFTFLGGTCARCTIDNTSVLVAAGSGPGALIAAQIEQFGARFGVRFVPHAIGNPDRKAHVERLFHYVEHNFLPGRAFADWPDINAQARTWCETSPTRRSSAPWAPPRGPPSNRSARRCARCRPISRRCVSSPIGWSTPRAMCIWRPTAIRCPSDCWARRWSSTSTSTRWRSTFRAVRWPATRGPSANASGASAPRVITARRAPDAAIRPRRSRRCWWMPRAVLGDYVKALVAHAPGRGAARLKRLLQLQRTYPSEPFLAAVAQALAYGLYDLTRLESLILKQVRGAFFQLRQED